MKYTRPRRDKVEARLLEFSRTTNISFFFSWPSFHFTPPLANKASSASFQPTTGLLTCCAWASPVGVSIRKSVVFPFPPFPFMVSFCLESIFTHHCWGRLFRTRDLLLGSAKEIFYLLKCTNGLNMTRKKELPPRAPRRK